MNNEADADALRVAERALNDGIIAANISSSSEAFLVMVDEFYSDTVEVRSTASIEPIIGKAALRSALFRYLIPLQVMAESGGLYIWLQVTPLESDSREERHSHWSLELVGLTGRPVRMTWMVRRRWQQSRVVHEYHYDYHHEGERLLLSALRIAMRSVK